MRAFQVYFKANQDWINKGTKRSAIRLRQALSEIRRICSARRVVVREWAIEKEAELDARAERRAQKQGNEATKDDN
jgi:hypothetical protein